MSRVLVAAPTCQQKDYAFERWVDAYRNFTYPHRSAFLVDNTGGTLDYVHRIRKAGIPAMHVEPLPNRGINFIHTLEICWPLIANRAVLGGYDYVLSIETDVICPPETIEVLLAHADGHDVVGHSYPFRSCWHAANGAAIAMVALGCTLIRTDWLAEGLDLWTEGPEQGIWGGTEKVELEGLLKIEHLDEGE